MRSIFLWPLLLAMLLCDVAVTQHHAFKHYTVEHGLPSAEVYEVMQDRLGYLWFATDRGICRYDGYNFRTYTTRDGLPDNTVFGFFEDEKGRIWLRTLNGKLAYFFDGLIYHHSITMNGIPFSPNQINSLYVDEGDTVFVGGPMGLFKMAPNNGSYLAIPITGSALFAVDKHQVIYGSRCPKVKASLNVREKKLPIKLDDFSNARFALKRANDEQLIIIDNDVYVLNGTEAQSIQTFPAEVTTVYEDAAQNLWVGLRGRGMYCYSGGDLTTTPTYHLLPQSSIGSMMIDREGGYWLTTIDNGVYYLPNLNFWVYGQEEGLLEENVRQVVAINDSTVYIGLFTKGLQRLNVQGTIERIPIETTIGKTIEVKSIDNAHSNGLWVMGRGIGITRLQNDSVHSRMRVDGMKMLNCNKDGTVELLCRDVIVKYDAKGVELERIAIPQGKMLRPEVLCKTNDTLWIGDGWGLWVYANKTYRFLGEQHRSFRTRITDIKATKYGIALATRGEGLVLKNGNQVVNLGEEEGLSGNICNQLLVEQDTIVWVCTNKGLSKVTLLGSETTIVNYGSEDGLPSRQVNHVSVTLTKVWVATHNGLAVFDKNYVARLSLLPVFIEDVIVGNDTVVGTQHELSYQQNHFTINFKGLGYSTPGRIIYRYRLKGWSDEWNTTNNTSITYHSLLPGTYEFSVLAMNNKGDVSPVPANLSFYIAPPFWQTTWFRLLCLLVIVSIVAVFFKIRVLTYNKDVVRELLQLLLQRLKRKTYYYVKVDGEVTRINIDHILYVKSEKNYIEIVTPGKKFLVRKAMKAVEREIPHRKNFLRVHRSYLIHLEKVDSFHSEYVRIDAHKIPVGRTYREQLQERKPHPQKQQWHWMHKITSLRSSRI